MIINKEDLEVINKLNHLECFKRGYTLAKKEEREKYSQALSKALKFQREEFEKKIDELENKGEWIEKADGTELWVVDLKWIKKLKKKEVNGR